MGRATSMQQARPASVWPLSCSQQPATCNLQPAGSLVAWGAEHPGALQERGGGPGKGWPKSTTALPRGPPARVGPCPAPGKRVDNNVRQAYNSTSLLSVVNPDLCLVLQDTWCRPVADSSTAAPSECCRYEHTAHQEAAAALVAGLDAHHAALGAGAMLPGGLRAGHSNAQPLDMEAVQTPAAACRRMASPGRVDRPGSRWPPLP